MANFGEGFMDSSVPTWTILAGVGIAWWFGLLNFDLQALTPQIGDQ